MAEQGSEVRIGDVVIDDESGIDGHAGSLDRMAVPAQAIFRLEQCHTVTPRQQPGSRKTGNAAADDGNRQRLAAGGADIILPHQLLGPVGSV